MHGEPEDDDDDIGGDADPKVKIPLELYDAFDASVVTITPKGVPGIGMIGTSVPLPAATPEHFICLRGPCRYYWEMTTFIDAQNPAETWGPDGLKDMDTGIPLGRPPQQIHRTCLAHPGTETELTEGTVYSCSRWDPTEDGDVKARDKRRSRYYKRHPEIVPNAREVR